MLSPFFLDLNHLFCPSFVSFILPCFYCCCSYRDLIDELQISFMKDAVERKQEVRGLLIGIEMKLILEVASCEI